MKAVVMLRGKYILSFLPLFSILLFPTVVSADVFINEFSSSTTSDWIELYNSDSSPVDLTGWSIWDLVDNSTNTPDTIGANGFLVVTFSNKLNNAGDNIRLLDAGLNYIDGVNYGDGTELCLPSSEGSIGRKPDGSSGFVRFETATPGETNNTSTILPCQEPTPTSSPTLTPTPTDSPTPTPNPTQSPTPTPTPTQSPVPTPTPTPTDSPTPTPNPTIEPTDTPEPTPELTASPRPRIIGFFMRGPVCRITYKRVRFRFFSIWWPRLTCTR